MSREIWGVVYVRTEGDNEPTWYSDKDEAVAEYNNRSDKYWPSRLVRGHIFTFDTIHDGGKHDTVPWERGYEGHYYEEATQ